MTKLFLLKPDFTDNKIDDKGNLYFCPECASILGIIKYYPQLEKHLDIEYVDFKRPRKEIIKLIGGDNQSCPVLIIENHKDDNVDISYFKSYEDKLFVNSIELIAKYLHEKFGIGILHF